jgi:hypothetical protein
MSRAQVVSVLADAVLRVRAPRPVRVGIDGRSASGKPTLTHELAQQVKAVMRDCVKSLPADARGEAPKLEGQITIAVKDQKASITKSLVQLRDVKEGDALTAAKQCIESKSIGIGAPASAVPNLDAYTINVSFLIPKT